MAYAGETDGPTLKVKRYGTARAFLEETEEALLRHECEYNLKIGASRQLLEGVKGSERCRFYAVEGAGGGVLGLAMWTAPDYPMVVSHMAPPVIESFLEALAEDNLELPGVVGPKETVSIFSERWAARGAAVKLEMAQLVYEARRITVPPSAGGRLVVAGEAERDRALEWTEAFARECFPHQSEEAKRIGEMVPPLLSRGLLYFWRTREGEIVSMAARSRESPNGATVSLVYTPVHRRGRGHAARVVGSLSQRILESGKSFCALYTDAANPASNRLYRRLGYEVVGESAHYSFFAGMS